MALGQKGRSRVAEGKKNLFAKTEADEPQALEDIVSPVKKSKPDVRKNFNIPHALSEQLRHQAFIQRCTEVDIVRKALEAYLTSNKGDS